jgi:hypothetical protein
MIDGDVSMNIESGRFGGPLVQEPEVGPTPAELKAATDYAIALGERMIRASEEQGSSDTAQEDRVRCSHEPSY